MKKKKTNDFTYDGVNLIVVSKNRNIQEILDVYNEGNIDFGENRVQELISKKEELPDDINWHIIGHLQNNKVKYIAPFVYLIHSVDSFRLIKEINKQAIKNNRVIDFLFQIKIADENTKYGMKEDELFQIINSEGFKNLKNINLKGIMGMATATDSEEKIKKEFSLLKTIFDKVNKIKKIDYLSMGMSSDYKIAINCGSNMIRIGSAIFNN